jgi:hypothetical protein
VGRLPLTTVPRSLQEELTAASPAGTLRGWAPGWLSLAPQRTACGRSDAFPGRWRLLVLVAAGRLLLPGVERAGRALGR